MDHFRTFNLVSWLLRATVAVILLQTLFFKFTGARESVYIFSTLGAEPWGRIGSGIVELVAAVLILLPATTVYGAALSLGVITGAILSHLTRLGIAIPAVDDHGELFALAVAVFLASGAVLFLHRAELPVLGRLFERQNFGSR
ncbi:MAG: DoxX family protein [Acidobacteria bacterium]|nr:DoxX family protein [Acidobacteriota bacterium]